MLFCQLLFSNPKFYIMWIILVVFSIWVHECAHAVMAWSQGDDTAVSHGYLVPNPMKLMGIPAIISLLLVGITWGSVPVDYRKLKKGRLSPLLVSISGPVANLVLFLAFSFSGTLVFKMVGGDIDNIYFQAMLIGAVLNIVLFVLNLVPVPPLDGWIVSICLFPSIVKINQELRNGVMFGLFALVFLSFGYLFVYGQFVVVFTMKVFASIMGI